MKATLLVHILGVTLLLGCSPAPITPARFTFRTLDGGRGLWRCNTQTGEVHYCILTDGPGGRQWLLIPEPAPQELLPLSHNTQVIQPK